MHRLRTVLPRQSLSSFRPQQHRFHLFRNSDILRERVISSIYGVSRNLTFKQTSKRPKTHPPISMTVTALTTCDPFAQQFSQHKVVFGTLNILLKKVGLDH